MRHGPTAALLIASLTATSATAGPPQAPVVSSQSVAAEATTSAPGMTIVALVAVTLAVIAASAGSPAAPVVPSDSRLKTDVEPVGTAANGLTLYHYRYKGHSQRFEGVMAQEVLEHTPEAVHTLPGGYLAVDYAMLGLTTRMVD
ncbi:MAG: tail fiber domain-containing protein [Rhodobacteraceae bacterium]|nr:tail fiber domain-containing protein [Paracoccaceae bacterium]